MRLFLSRRWALFAIAVALLAYGAWWLGGWQFDRLEERRERNEVVERNETATPRAVQDVLAPGRAVDSDDEWSRVTATGVYDSDDTVIVRYRTRDGKSGINVVVPLVTEDGTALLVDRGWMPTDNRGIDAAEVPQPASGQVQVIGWVRADASGDSTKVANQSTRSISSTEIGRALDREVYGGFLQLSSEDPEPAEALTPSDLPELGDGPHFAYGLQWWFFGVLAIFGFCYLGYDEWRKAKRKSEPAPESPGEDSQGAEHASVDG